MANTVDFTNLAPIMYKSMTSVLREQVGFIPAVTLNSSGVTEASQGDPVKSLRVTPALDKATYTPAMAVPESGDKTNVYDSFAINQYVGKELPIKGETAKRLANVGDYGTWIEQEFSQMIRSAMNEIEAYVATVAKNGASRGYGTAGTTPFAANINSLVFLRKILQDNGCPLMDGQLNFVMDSSAGANMRTLGHLNQVNTSGDANLLRQGVLGNVMNFNLRESAGVAFHTAGTATGYDLTAGFGAGSTTLTVDGSDSGTILAGDITNFASGTANYVVKSSTATGAASGNIVVGRPGLTSALLSAAEGVTVGSYTANVGFHRSAIELALRAPAMPPGGDLAKDRIILVDPLTNIGLEFRLYAGYGMNKIELNIFYDAFAWQEELIATLIS